MVFVPPLFSANLPLAKGQYKVGYIPITHKPIVPFTHPQPIHQDTNTPGLKVHDISYSVFYPTTTNLEEGSSSIVGVNWVPEPFWEIIKGYQKFVRGKIGISDTYIKWIAGTLGYVTGRIKIPVSSYAPLRPPTDSSKYPLVIFSHGLAGTRHTYSQFCSDLASEGYIVLSVEHKDGSGPAVYIENDEEGQDGEPEVDNKILHCIRYEDLEFPEGEDKSLVKIGVLQVDIRLREVYEAFHSFKKLVNYKPSNRSVLNSDPSSMILSDEPTLNILMEVDETKENFDKKLDWIESLNGKVDTENLRLTGHSYGGGTMLHIIQNPSPNPELLPELPIKQVLVLDPWLEAVPEPIPSDSDKASPEMPPILAINSIGFTEWTEHFDRLMGMLKKANGNLCSIIGVKHQSFSDFPLLDPRSHKAAKHLLNRIQDLSLTFLKGELNQLAQFKGNGSDSGIILPSDNSDGKLDLEGKVDGDIVIHLIGQE